MRAHECDELAKGRAEALVIPAVDCLLQVVIQPLYLGKLLVG